MAAWEMAICLSCGAYSMREQPFPFGLRRAVRYPRLSLSWRPLRHVRNTSGGIGAFCTRHGNADIGVFYRVCHEKFRLEKMREIVSLRPVQSQKITKYYMHQEKIAEV
jgi:hypothetical protein